MILGVFKPTVALLRKVSPTADVLITIGRTSTSSYGTRPPFDRNANLRVTEPPSPTWGIGDGLPSAERAWEKQSSAVRKTWDLESIPSRDIYKLLTSAIVPRPVAFISSLSKEGKPNLAPFSYFSMVSHKPPMVSISFALSPRRPKDTRENILATKEFTVNIISEPFIEAANSTSVESPADTDEWLISGLTMEPSTGSVKPPLVRESAVSLECELYSSQDITVAESSEVSTTVILGTIKKIHIRESVLAEDGLSVDPAKLRPVARLGGTAYARLLDIFHLPRVSWKDIQEKYYNMQRRS